MSIFDGENSIPEIICRSMALSQLKSSLQTIDIALWQKTLKFV
jgi:hypothetical protein